MTSLPKIQISKSNNINVDLRRDSDLRMCAMSLIHTQAPKTTLQYAKMIYSVDKKKTTTYEKARACVHNTHMESACRILHTAICTKTRGSECAYQEDSA